MQTGAWWSSALAAMGTLACSLGIAVASWLLAALVFLKVRWTWEPPLEAWFCACAVQIAAEAWCAAPGRRIVRLVCVAMGQCCAWALGPVVDGRYYAIEELWTLDSIHFGAVTLSLIGGLAGSMVHTMTAVLGRTRDVEPVTSAD